MLTKLPVEKALDNDKHPCTPQYSGARLAARAGVPSRYNCKETVEHLKAVRVTFWKALWAIPSPVDKPFVESIQPCIAADTLRLKGDENYHANHVYLGMYTIIGHGFSFWLERTLASSSDNEQDTTWLSIYYDF